jgi:hypothetical protein
MMMKERVPFGEIGWMVRTVTPSRDGKPRLERFFMATFPDQVQAEAAVRAFPRHSDDTLIVGHRQLFPSDVTAFGLEPCKVKQYV